MAVEYTECMVIAREMFDSQMAAMRILEAHGLDSEGGPGRPAAPSAESEPGPPPAVP